MTRSRTTKPYAPEVHTSAQREYTLERAILIYASQGHAYASVHPVTADDDRPPRIGAGAPLTREGLGDLAGALGASAALSGFVPERLVYTAPGMVAWWVPAQWRRIWFDCRKPPAGDQPEQVVEGAGGAVANGADLADEIGARAFDRPAGRAGAKLLGQRSGDVPHPPLVFAVAGDRWYVRALASNTRPSADTALMVAPYFNVYESGAICTGNVRLPQSIGPETLEQWEHAFFRSKFTHPNATRICLHPGGGYAMWAEILERVARQGRGVTDWPAIFPETYLLPAGQSLAQWIKSIRKGDV